MADDDFDVHALQFTEEPADSSFPNQDTVIPGSEDTGEIPDFVPPDQRGFYQKILDGKQRSTKDRKRRPPRAKADKPTPGKPRPGAIAKPLTDFYTMLGTIITPFDKVCGGAIVANAEACGQALETLARENPAARRVLLALVETSVWGQLVVAHTPIVMTVAMHHVPAFREGVGEALAQSVNPPPDPTVNGSPNV